MRKIVNSLIKCLVRNMINIRFTWPLVFIYSKVIKEVSPLDKFDRGNKKNKTILALNPDRFRGDLKILSEKFRVLEIPFDWQGKILSLYWPKYFSKKVPFDVYCNPVGNKSLLKMQKRFRSFLRIFLKDLYKRLSIDCVIGAGVYYRHDYDWGSVSNEIGIPYIVLHKENLKEAKKTKEEFIDVVRTLNKFKGSHIIVHSQLIKDLLVQSEYVNAEKVSSLGCLRMDDFVCKIRDFKMKSNKRKKVVLFSFLYNAGIFKIGNDFEGHSKGWVTLFEHVHASIARLAIENKEVDFIIKTKWGANWIQAIEFHLKKYDIALEAIENLEIIVDVDIHKLIMESDVICCFNSTVMLEAAIAGLPVIVPYFDEALEPKYSDNVILKDYFYIFDVAHSVDEFEKLVIGRLDKKSVSRDCMEKRYEIFEKYVSTLEGNAKEKYTELINKIIEG